MKEVEMVIDGLPLVGLSAPVLLGIAVLMLLTGRLWTNAAYLQKCKESDQWREAYEKEREARIQSDHQTGELLELAKTTNSFIMAVFTNSERVRQTGGDLLVQTYPSPTEQPGGR